MNYGIHWEYVILFGYVLEHSTQVLNLEPVRGNTEKDPLAALKFSSES